MKAEIVRIAVATVAFFGNYQRNVLIRMNPQKREKAKVRVCLTPAPMIPGCSRVLSIT